MLWPCQILMFASTYTGTEKLFDLLKAVIREWLESPWPHEQERADYAQSF